MKLFDLHEQNLGYNAFGEWIKSKVEKRLDKGDSRLKDLLDSTTFTMDHVRLAIINGDCLRNPKAGSKSLGPTYLEQIVSSVLSDLVKDREMPLGKLNDARAYFGLERLRVKKARRRKKPVKPARRPNA